jgi:ABC-type tungstate transport system permease subunit
MKKTILPLLLIAAILLSLSGCAARGGEASSSDLRGEESNLAITSLVQGDPSLQVTYAVGLAATPLNAAGGRELFHWLQTEQAVNFLEAYRIGNSRQPVLQKTSGFTTKEFTITATKKYYDTITVAVSKVLMQSEILKDLVHEFETEYGYSVTFYAASEESLLEQLQNGNADVLLAEHFILEDAAQQSLLDDSEGMSYVDFLESEYILCGPDSDPAGILSQKDLSSALKAIADTRSPYLLPTGDAALMKCQSPLWAQALGIATDDAAAFDAEPFTGWLTKTDQIGPDALAQAEESKAYIFADRASYFVYCNEKQSQAEKE